MSNNNNPQTMEEQFKKLKNAYIKLKNNFQIQQGIKQSLEDENKNLKSKIEELEKKNKELKKELANLKGEEQISESQVLRKENEKIEQLEIKKAEIESKFLLLRDIDFDSSEKKFSGQKELFDKIKLIRNSVEDTLSILQEQRQVDVAFFQNCKNLDQTIENIKKVDQDIIKLGDLFSKLNQGIKKNIEICQRKIINTLQKIGERENIDVSFIEEILNEASNYLKKYEENIIKYGKITEEITQKNNEAKDLLNSTKEKLDEFLIELNQKVISEMKKVTPNPKEEDFYSSRLLRNSKIVDFRNNYDYINTYRKKMPSILEESIALIPENINLQDFVESQLLKTNWIEVATLTDDGGQEVDINFILMAVGLKNLMFYSSWSYGFDLFSKITILTTEINGKKVDAQFNGSHLTFKVKLGNGDKVPIHIKYKSIRKDVNKYYNTNFVGLSSSMAGRHAKYTLLVPEKFIVVNFEKEIFVDRGNGKWSWTGTVPEGGLETQIKVSPRKATWNVCLYGGVKSKQNINNTTFHTYKGFCSGNNKVIKYEVNTPKCNKIDGKIIIDKGDTIEVNFVDLGSKEGFLEQKITFENRSFGSWECNINPTIPEDQVKEKQKFKSLAEKIIKENKEQKPKHKKIGEWVHKTMTYKLSFSGKKMTASQILEIKTGVCEHFTILFNALLNAIDIPAIYCGGNTINDLKSDDDDGAHAWSLVKVNNKWYPMDATWGIFTGNIPISHLFGHFGNGGYGAVGTDTISFLKNKFSFKSLNLS